MNAVMHSKPEYIETNGLIAEVIRTSRRKSADIRVEEGAVSVVVPKDLDIERITQLLNDKQQWLKKKLNIQKEATPAGGKEYVSGESFPYLGRNYRLKVLYGAFEPVKLIQGRLVVTVSCAKDSGEEQAQMIRGALISWYKHPAYMKLKEKVKRYTATTCNGISHPEPSSIGIKSYKARWGSCSTKGKLDFNWKIIMAPNRMVDYVVVHELCHLKHHDHSPKFWKEVERILPDYLECKEWLKVNAGSLTL
jgi:predicted metal-dependent hydrolase